MRQLATIQRILELRPIPGADAIELATVLGWKVVVKKGEFQVGDLCVYAEVDSVFPEKPEFEFLRAKHFRIKTMKFNKFGKIISQGIAFPLSILVGTNYHDISLYEDTDVTELMGIIKYEAPEHSCLQGAGRGNWPGWIQKTDETRIQTCRHMLSDFISTAGLWYVSEKLDGSSFTAARRDDECICCSHNINLKLDESNDANAFVQAYRKYDMEARLKQLPKNYGLQGELLGPGCNGNKYKLTEHMLRFFSLFDVASFSYAPFAEFKAVYADLGLETVPILDENFSVLPTVDKMVEYATAMSVFNPAIWREGIVVRRKDDSNVSFKVINPEFQLKYD